MLSTLDEGVDFGSDLEPNDPKVKGEELLPAETVGTKPPLAGAVALVPDEVLGLSKEKVPTLGGGGGFEAVGKNPPAPDPLEELAPLGCLAISAFLLLPSGFQPAFFSASDRCAPYCWAREERALERSMKGSVSMVRDKNVRMELLRPRMEV